MADQFEVAPLVPEAAPAESTPAAQPAAAKPEGSERPDAQPKDEAKPEPQDGEAKPPKGVQKRLDELTRRANDAQRMNERFLAVIDRMASQGQLPKEDRAPDGPPKREQFETHEQYLEARADWSVAEAISKANAKAETERRKGEAAQRDAAWEGQIEAASTKYEDFDDVVRRPDLRITPVMAEAMKDCESGAEIAYHLGKHPKEAARIAGLSPVAQVREIGKIEAQLTKQPVRQASKAPAPIDPVGGGKSASSEDPNKMSQREYEAWAKKQGLR